MTRARVALSCAAALVALLDLPAARAQTAPGGKGVVIVQATRVPRAVAGLVDTTLRDRLQAAGSTPIAADAVASMRTMLRLPRRPGAQDWFRLGRGLLADRVLVASLGPAAGKIRVEVTLYTVTSEETLGRSATVAADELLATMARLADETLGVMPAPASAPTPAPPASAPAAPPASAPAVVAPAPPAAPPRVAAAAPPPPPAPAPAVLAPAPVASTPLVVSRPLPRPNPFHPTLALGLRSYYLFEEGRGGPMLDLELGFMRNNYRMGMLFRTYFGDKDSYLFGARFEGGPRWGRFRLSFGVDFGFIVTPDVGDDLDMALFSARLISGMLQWSHLALVVDVFSLDLYLIPADPTIDRDVQALGGFNSGASLVAYF